MDQFARCSGLAVASHFNHGTRVIGKQISLPSLNPMCRRSPLKRTVLARTCSVKLAVKVLIPCLYRSLLVLTRELENAIHFSAIIAAVAL